MDVSGYLFAGTQAIFEERYNPVRALEEQTVISSPENVLN